MKRRRLSDLYVIGKKVELDDGTGEPVVVWLQKLNSIDRESCMRRSMAAKAQFLMKADDETGEVFEAAYATMRDETDHRELVRLIIAEDAAHYRQRVEAELFADEEGWGKENYLQGLVDSWIGDDANPGLAAAQAEDPEDPDAKRVLAEIERFENEVSERVKVHADQLERDWEDTPKETLWRKAAHRILELRAADIFNREFERQQLFYCVREPDEHGKRYFGTLTEVDDLDDTVRATLTRHYSNLIVDSAEGKGSRATPSSSNSSDQPSAGEAQQDSGQEAVNA
jgi:hypothetical protein